MMANHDPLLTLFIFLSIGARSLRRFPFGNDGKNAEFDGRTDRSEAKSSYRKTGR